MVQRLFERCSEITKSRMLDVIAPYLASIGVHKNGTWAAQRIIDTAHLPSQVKIEKRIMFCFADPGIRSAWYVPTFSRMYLRCCWTSSVTMSCNAVSVWARSKINLFLTRLSTIAGKLLRGDSAHAPSAPHWKALTSQSGSR